MTTLSVMLLKVFNLISHHYSLAKKQLLSQHAFIGTFSDLRTCSESTSDTFIPIYLYKYLFIHLRLKASRYCHGKKLYDR